MSDQVAIDVQRMQVDVVAGVAGRVVAGVETGHLRWQTTRSFRFSACSLALRTSTFGTPAFLAGPGVRGRFDHSEPRRLS